MCLFSKRKQSSLQHDFTFRLWALALHQPGIPGSGSLAAASLRAPRDLWSNANSTAWWCCWFFIKTFSGLWYGVLGSAACDGSIEKCSVQPASRASACGVIWWNADSWTKCYKGKYAHKTTLNFDANELQISWTDFVFLQGKIWLLSSCIAVLFGCAWCNRSMRCEIFSPFSELSLLRC